MLIDARPGADGGVPTMTRTGNQVIYTDLEARTYIFTPFIGNAYTTLERYDFLTIPVDAPQTRDANALDLSAGWGQEELTVTISPESPVHAYTIYIFEASSDSTVATSAHSRERTRVVREDPQQGVRNITLSGAIPTEVANDRAIAA